MSLLCRSPHGERGLKSECVLQAIKAITSLSSRRAWIEMVYLSLFTYTFSGRSPHGERGLKFTSKDLHYNKSRSLSSRRAWIEISSANTNVSMLGSLSSRRAWIEIQAYMLHYQDRFVALLTESVD